MTPEKATYAIGWVEDTSTVCDRRGHQWVFVGQGSRLERNSLFDAPQYVAARKKMADWRETHVGLPDPDFAEANLVRYGPRPWTDVPTNKFQCPECGVKREFDA